MKPGGALIAAWALSTILSAVSSMAAATCVVCGEPTAGGAAVLHDNQAYPIHELPCRNTWNQAVAEGRLEGLANPLEPAGPWVQNLATRRTPFLPGDPILWTIFLLGAMTVSGGIATLLAAALERSLPAAFLLGFFVPAVGMVLVPVLPRRGPAASTITSKE